MRERGRCEGNRGEHRGRGRGVRVTGENSEGEGEV